MSSLPARGDALGPVITRRQFAITVRGLYPNCPQYHRGSLGKRFKRQPRRGRLLSVVAAIIDNWVRHNLTPYERLLYAPGEDPAKRENARKAVAARIAEIIAGWQAGSAAEDQAYQAIRADLHERRLSQGPSPELTADENIAIVAALSRWLEGRGQLVSRYEAPSKNPLRYFNDAKRLADLPVNSHEPVQADMTRHHEPSRRLERTKS